MRLLIAYGREFVTPRPYQLKDLAEAAGMSISGTRSAYDDDEISEVARQLGRPPPPPTHQLDRATGGCRGCGRRDGERGDRRWDGSSAMSKGRRTRAGRADKLRRRAAGRAAHSHRPTSAVRSTMEPAVGPAGARLH